MSEDERLPKLWRGRRRALLLGLAGTGLAQAGIAAASALLTPRLMTASSSRSEMVLATVLAALALGLGAVRALERVLAEGLGQDYVHSVRLHLIRAAMVGRGPSLGVTVARATNDLTSVRNWMVQGVVPLMSGIPMVLGCLVALALLDWRLSLAALIPVAVLGVMIVVVAPRLRERAAHLRKQRGKVAGHIADTMQAKSTIVEAGGVEREVRNLGKLSRELGNRAVHRATLSGLLRGSAASVATMGMVTVGTTAVLVGLDGPTIATAFLVVGMLATPVTDLGRVGEFRQSYRVAERILGPQIAVSRQHRRSEREMDHAITTGRVQVGRDDDRAGVHLADLELGGRRLPELVARPGEVVVPVTEDLSLLGRLADALAHPEAHRDAWLQVAGQQIGMLPPAHRRRLVGIAHARQPMERGTIGRAVRYRHPDSEASVDAVLAEVGVADAVAALPKGHRTSLRRGGEPLDAEQLTQLSIARALYGDPPLVVLNFVGRAISPAVREKVLQALPRPGVTLILTDEPERLELPHRTWRLDADPNKAQVK